MSWVKITNGVVETQVPKQAFLDLYQRNGFKLVVDPTQTDKKAEGKPNDESRTSTSTRSKNENSEHLPVADKRRG